jgi:DMSO/TMAO reductase YedYZ molybdopterin-dependent catalytic subunit
MTKQVLLTVEGEVDNPLGLTFDDLANFEARYQITDVSRIERSRQGDAVKLAGLLAMARAGPRARYLGLHSSQDDFHASIPLAPVRDQAFLIYRIGGEPLAREAGGPLRFFIPDAASCHSDEIDECASVKYVDRIELTAERGRDNRPLDDKEHADLHRRTSI